MNSRRLFLAILSLTSLCLSGCNDNSPVDQAIYFDGDIIENYQKYDKSYNPDTFKVRKIESLKGRKKDFVFGADISLFSAINESGSYYYNFDGKQESICKILKDAGVNVARLRLFNDYSSPTGVKCGKLDLSRVISMIKECKEYDMDVLLDFHYSDKWSDPGNQEIPYAWKNYSYSKVLQEFYKYTKETLLAIKNENLTVEYVQIGNEIDNGIIYPHGHIDWDNDREGTYDKLAEILSKGCKATREVFPKAKIIIHTGGCFAIWEYEDTWGNGEMHYYQALEDRHLDYDIIGGSYYTYNTTTPISLLSDIVDGYTEAFHKPVMMVENSYGYTFEWNDLTSNIFYTDDVHPDYPVSFQGQTDIVLDIVEELANAKNKGAIGYFYWGGEWIPNTDPDMRTSWSNQALFTYEGVATPTLSLFSNCFPD